MYSLLSFGAPNVVNELPVNPEIFLVDVAEQVATAKADEGS